MRPLAAARDPAGKAQCFYRAFNHVYNASERWYARLIARMVKRSGFMAIIVAGLVALSAYGLSQVPTAFLPVEDQGYFLAVVQLPKALLWSAQCGRWMALRSV